VLAVGWLLGGSVGVGTVVFAASIGPLVSLKNALDCLYWEWANKPVGFVSYSGGGSGGIRAVEMTRQVALTLSMLPLNEMVNLADVDSLIADGTLNPPEGATDMLHGLADSLANHLDASRLLRSR
jgi:NAD(P)H-dependent FMN reductase